MGFISTPKRQKVIDGIFRPSSSSSSLSSPLSLTSSPRITLAPRCLEFFPTSSLSSSPTATATTTTIMGTSELEILKGKRLFVIDDNDDDDDDEYKEDDSTMKLMKENEDYDTVYNKSS